mmetsp:Transcript_21873/g.49876  ORF Transcript_21873/g.49876 Transcript_21873/m.49876 type:complete len:101 (-) Transcript_21873:89-391(-)
MLFVVKLDTQLSMDARRLLDPVVRWLSQNSEGRGGGSGGSVPSFPFAVFLSGLWSMSRLPESVSGDVFAARLPMPSQLYWVKVRKCSGCLQQPVLHSHHT